MEINSGYDAASLWPSYSACGFVPGQHSFTPFLLCPLFSPLLSPWPARIVAFRRTCCIIGLIILGVLGGAGVCLLKKVQPRGRQHPGWTSSIIAYAFVREVRAANRYMCEEIKRGHRKEITLDFPFNQSGYTL
jgi:hypothetical protein